MDTQEPLERLYARHKGLISSLIKSIVVNNKSVVSVADLQQVGAMALIVALKTYDPSSGTLSSYVRRCIRNALLEEANSFSGVFTVDEKIRRQANKAHAMKKAGKSDHEIMQALGIKTEGTYYSLLNLVENKTVDLEQIEHIASSSIDEDGINRVLDELGLTNVERKAILLLIEQSSALEIEKKTGITRNQLANLKIMIGEKITSWGKYD